MRTALHAGLVLALVALAQPARAQQASPSFEEYLARLRTESTSKGIRADVVDRALNGITVDPQVLDLLNRQPEHDRTAGDYVRLLVTPERVETGRAKLAEQGNLLGKLESTFGVDRHVLVAIWGVESRFGASQGDKGVVRSLATLAHGDPRRSAFWQGELLAALRIIQNGDIAAESMLGSWAGAMGHTQFMPSTYLKHAYDSDNDGRRDVWGTLGDALGSTANYLKASGWTAGLPWGFEVRLPPGFDYAHSAPGKPKTAADWQSLGVSSRDGAWPASTAELGLLLPAGAAGPAFLVSQNFRAILRYNASSAYALAVGLLADALATGSQPALAWPEGEIALTRAEREELQKLLASLGHEVGSPDAIIGSQTRAAIRTWQRAQSLPQDGHPSRDLLMRLRAAQTEQK